MASILAQEPASSPGRASFAPHFPSGRRRTRRAGRQRAGTLVHLPAQAGRLGRERRCADGRHARPILVPLSLAWIDERVVLPSRRFGHGREHHQPATGPAHRRPLAPAIRQPRNSRETRSRLGVSAGFVCSSARMGHRWAFGTEGCDDRIFVQVHCDRYEVSRAASAGGGPGSGLRSWQDLNIGDLAFLASCIGGLGQGRST